MSRIRITIKISDLQRRLDPQYDRIDEVEETMAELKSQIYELKKNQIDADSIYGFLGAFNGMYGCRKETVHAGIY